MLRRLSHRPSPAMGVALLALILSLGGVSYGVATGSINSREIKNNTVVSKDLRNNNVRGKDLRNSTVAGRDVANNTLKGADIDESGLGQVPSAANAASATNAGTVDGKSADCPSATTLYLGQCFENTARAAGASSTVASDDCADEGRYLPNPLQLRTFGQRPEITLAAPSEYSDAVYSDENGMVITFKVVTVADNGLFTGEAFNLARPYRCVAPLVG